MAALVAKFLAPIIIDKVGKGIVDAVQKKKKKKRRQAKKQRRAAQARAKAVNDRAARAKRGQMPPRDPRQRVVFM